MKNLSKKEKSIVLGIIGALVILGLMLIPERGRVTMGLIYKEDSSVSMRFFRARLVSVPDHHKQMQWLAVPVSSSGDTVLIDFDLGEFPEIASGDIVPVVGEQQSSGQWTYWYEPHWLDRRKFLLEAA